MREEAFGAAEVEAQKRDPAVPLELLEQQARDQEPRDHEKHVHADVPAPRKLEPRAVEQHGDDGDGPQTLDVRPEGGLA